LSTAVLHRRATFSDVFIMRAGLIVVVLYLLCTLAFPLYALLSKSVRDRDGVFVGLANFARFMREPGLSVAVWNSFFVATVATSITVVLAFMIAYGLHRTRMPFKGAFRVVAMMPLLAPSMLPGIALVYLFGRQGIFRWVLGDNTIYGPIGIIIGEVLFSLPHAVLIIGTALAIADQRLYDSARVLRAGTVRTFLTVTLPGCRYGLISAFLAVFTLVFTDFGVPAAIGGSYPVLATEVYKQVVGRFDFEMGAVVGIFLLLPAVVSFIVDQLVRRRQGLVTTGSSTPLEIRPNRLRDGVFLVICATIAGAVLAIFVMAALGSLFRLWPYNLELTLRHYEFRGVDGTGWHVYFNSLKLAFLSASIGVVLIFLGAYFVEKLRGSGPLRGLAQLLCMIPLAVPGMVLGLSFIFFFNDPANPLNFIYGTMIILVASTVTHFYTVPHLTAITALRQIDPDFESVGQSLKARFHVVLARVTVPICLPVILSLWTYLFVNAMTTVSAVIFLYTAQTEVSAVTIVRWINGGKIPSAAALSVVIFVTSAAVWMLQALLMRRLVRRTQAWQNSGRT
jgi:iron(III) transport system permease protein